MTTLEIFYLYAPVYLVRNILTFINFLRKQKKGELSEVVEVSPEKAIESLKGSEGPMIALTVFEVIWGVIGWFTPFGLFFIAISINNIMRLWTTAKAPREKAASLFTLNSIIQIGVIASLVYNIYKDVL